MEKFIIFILKKVEVDIYNHFWVIIARTEQYAAIINQYSFSIIHKQI